MLTQKDIVRSACHAPAEISIFFDRFPWARRYIDDTVSQVHISCIEPALLGYYGQRHDLGEKFRTYPVYERILLLDGNGSVVISKNKEYTGQHRHWMLGWLLGEPKIYEPVTGEVMCGATIGRKVEKLGDDAERVRFILSWYPYNHTVILYEIPEGTPLLEWIKQ